MNRRLVIGTRGSRLALRQADWAKNRLQELNEGLNVEIRTVKTTGDILTNVSLSVIGGKGVFTKELEIALLSGEVDIAVHSLKDLPTRLPESLTIGAITEREDARDALLLRPGLQVAKPSIAELPGNALIGTSSLRRSSQLKHFRPDIRIADLRGNVDSRVRRVDNGEYDAIVLAAAGLHRLGLYDRVTAFIGFEEMLSAVGQGSLAIEVRSDDTRTLSIVAGLDDPSARLTCESERAFLSRLGGGCQMPIAAHATMENGSIRLDGLVAEVSGQIIVRGSASAPIADSARVGETLADQLLCEGAGPLLDRMTA